MSTKFHEFFDDFFWKVKWGKKSRQIEGVFELNRKNVNKDWRIFSWFFSENWKWDIFVWFSNIVMKPLLGVRIDTQGHRQLGPQFISLLLLKPSFSDHYLFPVTKQKPVRHSDL